MPRRGWWPALSASGAYLVVNRQATKSIVLIDARTGADLWADEHWSKTAQPQWIAPRAVSWRIEQTDEDGKSTGPDLHYRRGVAASEAIQLGTAPGTQYVAADGHWASWGGNLRRDGRVIAQGVGGAITCSGELVGHLAHRDTDKPGQVYVIRRGEFPAYSLTLRSRPLDPCLLADLAGPALVYGGHGARIWGWRPAEFETDLTAAPAGWTESQPHVAAVGDALWVVTLAQSSGRLLALARPWGATDCVQVRLPSARVLTVAGGVDGLTLCVEDDSHKLYVVPILADTPRSAVLPVAASVEYFACFSDLQHVAPGNAILMADDASAATLPDDGRPIICGAPYLSRVPRARIVAIYLSAESYGTDLQKTSDAGLELKAQGWTVPIIAYVGAARCTKVYPGIDYPGIPAYWTADTPTADAIVAKWGSDVAACGYPRVVLVGDATDGGGRGIGHRSDAECADLWTRLRAEIKAQPPWSVLAFCWDRGSAKAVDLVDLPETQGVIRQLAE